MDSHLHDSAAHEAAHDDHSSHPGWKFYTFIGVVLTVITAIEVALFYIPALANVLVPSLLVLSLAKFILVAMFYMHLRQDSKLFSGVFVFPLIIATVVIVSLMILMAYHMAFARAG